MQYGDEHNVPFKINPIWVSNLEKDVTLDPGGVISLKPLKDCKIKQTLQIIHLQ